MRAKKILLLLGLYPGLTTPANMRLLLQGFVIALGFVSPGVDAICGVSVISDHFARA
jgi:hypothetical protein